MKKIIALLLMCCMLCTMAACTPTPSDNTSETPNTSENPTPDTPGDETTDESKPGDDTSDDKPTDPFDWDSITKEVALPTFKESTKQELVVCQKDGKDTLATVVVSPLAVEDYDINAIKEQLKQNPLFQNWAFGHETTEKGNVYLYDDIGQQTSYEYTKSIVALEEYYEGATWYTDFQVDFQGNTQSTIGYTNISLESYIDVKGLTQTEVDALYQAVRAVFGEYADYLFYAPRGEYEDHMSVEIEQENGLITLTRIVRDNKVAFSIEFCDSLLRTFNGCAGNGEYTPMLGTPEGLFDLLNPAFGPCDMNDYANIASNYFKDNYPGFTHLIPDDGYVCRKLVADNGHSVVTFELDGEVGPDLGKSFGRWFFIEYELNQDNEGIAFHNIDISIPLGVVDNKAYYNAFKQQCFNQAVQVLELLFKGNQDVANNLQLDTNNETSKYDSYVEIDGIRYYFAYSYTCEKTTSDTYAAWVEAKLQREGPVES